MVTRLAGRSQPGYIETSMRTLLSLWLSFAPAVASATESPASSAEASGVLLTGDSMMRVGLAPVLKKTLPEVTGEAVTMHAKSATGLARPDAYDWLKELPKFLKDTRYATVVIAMGSNDCQNLAVPGQKAIAYGTPAWDQAYRARVKAVLDLLCAAADQVLWLGLPPMRNAKFNGRVTSLNTLLASEVGASACGQFLPVSSKLADGKGHYAQFVKVGKHKLRVREDDGIHLTQNGGRLISELVVASLKK